MTRQVSEFNNYKKIFLCIFVIIYFCMLLQISHELSLLGNAFLEKAFFGKID